MRIVSMWFISRSSKCSIWTLFWVQTARQDMASRDSRDAYQNISRPWICVSFRSSLSFQLRRNLDCWNFANICESFLIILTFSFFIWICPCLVSRLVPVPFNIFVLLWRLRFFVNGWISVVKKLLPPDNTRGTKKMLLLQIHTKIIKKIVFTE